MKVKFTETALRDANQSLIATRLPWQAIEPILPAMDKAGYYSVECWGGAVFDCCLRYLQEDPWTRLRKLREGLPNTKLQMLLRGQNLLGYKHYPDDAVKKFVDKSIENGIDIIRIFDALNDIRNLEVAVKEAKKGGALVSGAISYTTSPVHTLESFADYAKRLADLGVDTICVKDMAGVMSPKEAFDLVKAIKAKVKLPLILHTHSTTGLAFMTYLKGVEAGADIIDTAISSFSGGSSQPSTETLNYALKQLGYETDLDEEILKEIDDHFKTLRDDYLKDGTLNPRMLVTDANALSYKVPGGMLSNLVAQLKQQNALDRLDEVLEETPKVRADLGYPPLVTPMSQMVGVQATSNVLLGRRYASITKEVKSYVRGEYGTPPAPISKEMIKIVLGDEVPLKERFADGLKPIFEETKAKLKGKAKSDEDVLSYILFPQVTERYWEIEEEKTSRKVKYSILKGENK